MTVREKLELLAQSEARNAAVIAAYKEGVTTGIASTVALLGQLNLTVEDGAILAMLAEAYAKGAYDAPSNESLEGESDDSKLEESS